MNRPLDDFEIEYHLTPDGWQPGSEWFLGRIQAETAPPSNRVLAIGKRIHQRSLPSERHVTLTTLWNSAGLSGREIDALKSRFQLPEWP